jgi:hypothetical protein
MKFPRYFFVVTLPRNQVVGKIELLIRDRLISKNVTQLLTLVCSDSDIILANLGTKIGE